MDNYNFSESIIKVIAIVLALLANNVYAGAVFIAFISAITRTSYEAECSSHVNCMTRVVRYFIMALGIAFFIVHLGLWQSWDANLTIIITSYFTFLSEETIRFLLQSSKQAIPAILRRFYDVENRK